MRSAPDTLLLSLLRGDEPAAVSAEQWRRATAAARGEGLEAWLYRRIARIAGDVPDDVRDGLRAASAGVVARALALAAELATILRALAGAGVACAPLRGAALAERLYDDACARPAGDIDLLVRCADLDAVETTLGALGFRPVDRRAGFAREFSYTLELARPGVVVEPHWTLAYPPFADALDMERVWTRCRPGRVVGQPALLLSSESVLLNLCLHLIHKAPDVPLLWLLDIDRLVRREALAIDWDELLALTRRARLERQLGAALRGVVELLGTPLPFRVLAALDVARPAALDPLLVPDAGVDGRESLALLFALSGVRRRARYAAALLFPSPGFMTMEYGVAGPGGLALAYGRRARHLLWQGLRGTARLLRHI
jgi:putative nucleotidyltransferase-like protein